jgi:uncharacterized protein YceK
MSRWLPMAALLAALVLSTVSGCGSSATTGGKEGAPTHGAGANTGKTADTARDTGKGAGHHDPG